MSLSSPWKWNVKFFFLHGSTSKAARGTGRVQANMLDGTSGRSVDWRLILLSQ